MPFQKSCFTEHWSWTRPISQPGIPTPIHQARRANGTSQRRRSDSLSTPSGSSPSVRVFYPKHDTSAVIRAITGGIAELEQRIPLLLVVLFGSYAKGNYTVSSDVDLLVVYRGAPRPDAFALVKQTLDVPRLEPHVYAEEEYQVLKETIDRMVQGGIRLFPPDEGRRV
ncbi:MAG: nucleotidyltransferase domain-containing protein [Chloroflexi bacterium]|nr:nucleotidyltransferase domain-containing protein [Chloroflexota bacterium]